VSRRGRGRRGDGAGLRIRDRRGLIRGSSDSRLLGLSRNWFILADFKSDFDHWLLVIIDSHLTVILIILFMLKQSDPLLVCVEPAV